MKKLFSLFIIIVIVFFAMEAMSQHMGYRGMMGGGPGGWGRGWWGGEQPDTKISKEIYEAWEKHYQDTAKLRENIWIKRHEMATLLADPKTEKEELLKKQAELQKLVNELQRKQLIFRWELRQKYPQQAPDPYGGCYGPGLCFEDDNQTGRPPYGGYGRGRGWMHRGYGGHHGMMSPWGYGRDYHMWSPGLRGE